METIKLIFYLVLYMIGMGLLAYSVYVSYLSNPRTFLFAATFSAVVMIIIRIFEKR